MVAIAAKHDGDAIRADVQASGTRRDPAGLDVRVIRLALPASFGAYNEFETEIGLVDTLVASFVSGAPGLLSLAVRLDGGSPYFD